MNNYNVNWEEEPNLGELRRLYQELSTNPSAALPGLEALGERGSLASALYLADFYAKDGAYADPQKTRYWYSKALEQGYPPASYMLGRIYSQLGERALAFSAFSKGAERGYLPSIYRLAKMYQHGEGVAENSAEYRRLLELAYSRGHIFSKRDLGALLLTGGFGVASAIRGLLILLSLWSDIGLLIWKAVKPGSTFDERILA
jgi:TPR repeat protein